jgi:hypothetical protein
MTEETLAGLEYVARRLQADIDDGSRPDQWSMEDMVRKVRAALAAERQAAPEPVCPVCFESEPQTGTCGGPNDPRALCVASPPPAQPPDGIPAGWVPLRIEHEPGYPEDVAFGPQRMMDRLKKWLDGYFARIVAEKNAHGDLAAASNGDVPDDGRSFSERFDGIVRAAQPPREALTDEQIDAAWDAEWGNHFCDRPKVRATVRRLVRGEKPA